MADIANLPFGKNLRPSTVDAMNKINEIIGVVNTLQNSDSAQRITALETRVTTAEGRITTNAGNITTLQGDVAENSDDISDIKTTLYTPLASNENSNS